MASVTILSIRSSFEKIRLTTHIADGRRFKRETLIPLKSMCWVDFILISLLALCIFLGLIGNGTTLLIGELFFVSSFNRTWKDKFLWAERKWMSLHHLNTYKYGISFMHSFVLQEDLFVPFKTQLETVSMCFCPSITKENAAMIGDQNISSTILSTFILLSQTFWAHSYYPLSL